MRVLVATVVHDPRDARIAAREIASLLAAGHRVTYLAPFQHFGVAPMPGVECVDVPAAHGRHRLSALVAATRTLRKMAPDHDVVLVHSPELLLAVATLTHRCIVWDVHEDLPASISLKGWVPRPLRSITQRLARRMELRAEAHYHLLLAEDSYQQRFHDSHPVIPNSTTVPAVVPAVGGDRIVYVGHVTRARGGVEMLEVAQQLHGEVSVHLIGSADREMTVLVRAAQERGEVIWHGYVANGQALAMIEGAIAGLALLHDEPNYRHSRPTKIMEYLAHGVPAIATNLPVAKALIEDSGGGEVVGFGDTNAVVDIVRRWRADPALGQTFADTGREWVTTHMNWANDGVRFVSQLQEWSRPTQRG